MSMKLIVKTWVFESSSSNGTYQTLQYEDGTTSCDCKGWTRRVQPDGSRQCKHTRAVDMGIADRECLTKREFIVTDAGWKPKPVKKTALAPAAPVKTRCFDFTEEDV